MEYCTVDDSRDDYRSACRGGAGCGCVRRMTCVTILCRALSRGGGVVGEKALTGNGDRQRRTAASRRIQEDGFLGRHEEVDGATGDNRGIPRYSFLEGKKRKTKA